MEEEKFKEVKCRRHRVSDPVAAMDIVDAPIKERAKANVEKEAKAKVKARVKDKILNKEYNLNFKFT